jgi:dTDP-D-glucose 4,6-dehydratase
LKLFIKKKNLDPKEYIINVKDRAGKDKNYKIIDNDTRNKLNWKNTITFYKGINKVIEWYDEYKNKFTKKDEKFSI